MKKRIPSVVPRLTLWAGIVLLFSGLFGSCHVASLINPGLAGEKREYSALLERQDKAVTRNDLGPGDVAEVRLGIQTESAGGRWAVDGVIFRPADSTLTPWIGPSRPQEWGKRIVGKTKKFAAFAKIQIPQLEELEGATVTGVLTATVYYPVGTGKHGALFEQYRTIREQVEIPLTLHVFSSEILTHGRIVENRFKSIVWWSAGLTILPGLLLLFAALALLRKDCADAVGVILSLGSAVAGTALIVDWLNLTGKWESKGDAVLGIGVAFVFFVGLFIFVAVMTSRLRKTLLRIAR